MSEYTPTDFKAGDISKGDFHVQFYASAIKTMQAKFSLSL